MGISVVQPEARAMRMANYVNEANISGGLLDILKEHRNEHQ
jgi:hypothetical protein